MMYCSHGKEGKDFDECPLCEWKDLGLGSDINVWQLLFMFDIQQRIGHRPVHKHYEHSIS
jgi:hypothetical protein